MLRPMRPDLLARVLVTSALLAAACGGDDPPLELADGCQPLLGGHDCLAPFPSDYFRLPDDSTATGFRIATEGAAVEVSRGDGDIHRVFTFDGFSPIPTIVAVLPSEVAATGLVPLAGPAAASMVASSPTLLIDADTGALVPHYVDLDPRYIDPTRQAIVIHPLVALAERTRYVVALHGIVRPDGRPAAAAEGFRRLRDRQAEGEPALRSLIAHYDSAIFPLVEAAGVARGELQLAWDFTVGSHHAAVADMLAVRAATLAWLEDNSPAVTVTEVEQSEEGKDWRTVRGRLTGPLFLEVDRAGAPLVRGGDGLPVVSGTTSFEFVAKVPAAVRDRLAAGRPLPYGHGFFGNLGEHDSGKTVNLFDATGSVGFGVVWAGMSDDDIAEVLRDLSGDPGQTLRFGDRIHQGMANWLTLSAAIRGPLTERAELRRPTEAGQPGVVVEGEVSNAGELLYDPAEIDFLGISQGHILGGTMAALDPGLRRVALQVGGAGFTHMMFRSNNFQPFLLVMSGVIPDPLHQQLFVATLQPAFDRFESGSYARYLSDEPLEGSHPERRVLLQIGLGDVSVPNLGSFLHARLLGVPVVTPSPATPFGLEPAAAPLDGSGLTLWDFGVDHSVYDVADPSGVGNVVHEGVRQEAAAIDQLRRFLDSGRIEHTCDGVCDPG
jgi:hypothetical protein